MSIVIDEVEKELSKDYRTYRKNPNNLRVYSNIEDSSCEIYTGDQNSFICQIYRPHPTISDIHYESSWIINWVKKAL